jgi:hypothetical protein
MLGFTLHPPTLGLLCNNGSGSTVPANLGVSFYAQPRRSAWTNSLTS